MHGSAVPGQVEIFERRAGEQEFPEIGSRAEQGFIVLFSEDDDSIFVRADALRTFRQSEVYHFRETIFCIRELPLQWGVLLLRVNRFPDQREVGDPPGYCDGRTQQQGL